jgi:hypothetical protein
MTIDAMIDVPAVPICLDRWPRPAGAPTISTAMNLLAPIPPPLEVRTDAVIQLSYLWDAGDTVRVAFLDGDPCLQRLVMAAALEWTLHANLVLRFVGVVEESDIRVSFADRRSAWSRIGTDCRSVAHPLPTMNLGLLLAEAFEGELKQLVLHEFGHALGLLHEHQHPASGIAWNRPAVYHFYGQSPYYWNIDDVDENIFDLYSRDRTVHTALDARSIMMYPISPALTTDGFAVGLNKRLSRTDVEFIAECYPAGSTRP